MKGLSVSMIVMVLSIFSGGCVSHNMWVEGRDQQIGTKFNPSSTTNRDSTGHGYRTFIPKGERVYYRLDQEPPNTRYFIQWTRHCRYSLLVAPDGTILSWRFEDTKDPEQACVIH